MRIAHNIAALSAFNELNSTNNALQKTITALSTGLRINSAADDAAGFAISEKMRSQIRGLDVALRNSQDGISLLQTAEGALGNTNSLLQRMRELAVQASNDTLTTQDRSYIQLEVDQLKDQIDRIAGTTQFNKKRILDGSSGAIWSSSDLSVKARIHGGLTEIDNFGQKINHEGNYRIEIKTDPGQAQIQKTNVMYTMPGEGYAGTSAKIVFVIDVSGSMGGELQKVKDNIEAFKQKVEDSSVNDVEIGICVYGTDTIDDPKFIAYRFPAGTPTDSEEGSLWSSDIDEIMAVLDPITAPYAYDTYNYYAVQMAAETYADTYGENRYMVLVTDVDHTNYPDAGLSPAGAREDYTEETVRAALLGDSSAADDIKLTVIGPQPNDESSEFFNLCTETEGKMFLSGTDWKDDLIDDLGVSIGEEAGAGAAFEYPPKPDRKLSAINTFVTPEGNFLLREPKTLTLHQGGKSTTITLDASDSLRTLTAKLNKAVEIGLGQGKYVSGGAHFASYVSEEETTNNGSQSVPGTIIMRSLVPGKEGEITFSGDDDLLNALGLNTIQESSETTFTASVYDAHSGKVIASSVNFTGNVLTGVIPNVDIEIDPMAGISAVWDDTTKRFVTSGEEKYTAFLHLKNNGIAFQIGANQGEDFLLQLGDSSCSSLNLSGVDMSSRESASRSIGIIDRAINTISSQRAKLGAYQNALEHTMSNLTTTSTNLTASESRIRDADMASTMMEFVKLQILNQSGTSMLAQANMMPQSVLTFMS